MKIPNKASLALPLFALATIGCSGGGPDQALDLTRPNASAGNAERGQPKLASQATDPRLKQAAMTQRAVIRNASLTVRVGNPEQAERKVNAYVAAHDGYVVSSESSDLNEASPTISLKVRVPAAGFDEAMLSFEGFGTRLGKKVSGEDVTNQLVDLDARLKIMRAQEDSLRVMLTKASNQRAALDLQTQIMELRGQIESLAGQRKTAGDLAALSTIDLTLVGETKGITAMDDKGWAQESWNMATNILGSAVHMLGGLCIFLLVLAPIWVPFAIVAVHFAKKSAAKVPR